MARLSQVPDPLYTTPLSSRTTKPVASDQRSMPSSPPLRPLALETSLQSHGNDNLPASPPRQDFGRSSLSPADCRTLEKILRDVSSPPATPSTLEQSDQLFPDNGRISTTATADEENGGYHFVGGEATDTGYEDEDDSMELSEGGETVTHQVVTSLGEPASPSVSYSERRLQESVSAHDEKEKLRYSSGRRSSTTRRSKTKRSQQERAAPQDATGADMIEDLMNIPDKRAPPARPLDLARNDSDRQKIDDIKQLTRMRLSTEKVLEQERLEQEHAESDEEPGVFISTVSGPQGQAQDDGESELDGFAADDEQTRPRFGLGTSGAPRRKVCEAATCQEASED